MLKEIIWQAPEFKYRDKDISWYWMTIIIASLLVLISLWQRNFLFAIFTIIAEIMLMFWANEFPKDLQFKIDKNGIHIGKIKSYSYEEISGFHIIEGEDGAGELILKTKNKIHPYIKILLANEDTQKVKDYLKPHLSEMDYEESLSDIIFRIVGF